MHEVKKDNLSIVRGIEGEVAGTGTDQGEQMWMSDLFLILQDTMRHILGEKKADIDLLCRCESDFATGEHYRIMSILKNLVINAAEAIQSGKGTGVIWVDERVEEPPGPCGICFRWATPPNLTPRPETSAGASDCPRWNLWSRSWAAASR